MSLLKERLIRNGDDLGLWFWVFGLSLFEFCVLNSVLEACPSNLSEKLRGLLMRRAKTKDQPFP